MVSGATTDAAMEAKMVIEVEGVVKRFGRRTALAGVDLAVAAGEVVGVAGPNGAGKSTFIHLLLGLLRADGGSLRVLGHDPLGRRHLGATGWMPERPAFPPRRRVRDLVSFQAATFPRWDRSLAEEWVERLELPMDDRAGDLSRGGLARLALVFALAHRPRLLLLDDPTLGLDPSGRRLVMGEVLAAAAESGAGVLVATHLLAEAERSLDRLVLLAEGRVGFDEPVDALRERHRRLRLPPGVEAPPELAARQTAAGLVATRFDEPAWTALRRRHPEARAEAIDLEELYVAYTGRPVGEDVDEQDEAKGVAA